MTDFDIWFIAIFVSVLLIIFFVVWKKISQGLDSRAQRIEQEMHEAELANKEAHKLLEEQKSVLANIQREAQKVLEKALKDAEVEKNKIIENAKKEAEELLKVADQQIELAKLRAAYEVKRQIANYAANLAEKMIEGSMKPEDHRKIMNNIISEITKN